VFVLAGLAAVLLFASRRVERRVVRPQPHAAAN
jgi:hypothetical protein